LRVFSLHLVEQFSIQFQEQSISNWGVQTTHVHHIVTDCQFQRKTQMHHTADSATTTEFPAPRHGSLLSQRRFSNNWLIATGAGVPKFHAASLGCR